MSPEAKYTEDAPESEVLLKVDMGDIDVGILKPEAEEIRPKFISELKKHMNDFNGSIVSFSDLRQKFQFDRNDAFRCMALCEHYALAVLEKPNGSRNPGMTLTELGVSSLGLKSKAKV